MGPKRNILFKLVHISEKKKLLQKIAVTEVTPFVAFRATKVISQNSARSMPIVCCLAAQCGMIFEFRHVVQTSHGLGLTIPCLFCAMLHLLLLTYLVIFRSIWLVLPALLGWLLPPFLPILCLRVAFSIFVLVVFGHIIIST